MAALEDLHYNTASFPGLRPQQADQMENARRKQEGSLKRAAGAAAKESLLASGEDGRRRADWSVQDATSQREVMARSVEEVLASFKTQE